MDEKCPRCEGRLLPIVYGYPAPSLFDRASAGEVRLGGCVVSSDSPQWSCADCGTEFRDEAGGLTAVGADESD
ncbi:hypothetical protein [Yinghuangia seranimata]|uniref:hypothetical protein n=1 Tax=Yinghuangia seranimata TaxID=408067 RepID=UPI00248A9363|nr:hypothetical protein [Yinghuangia seranimata]MDI2131110.1 hypothetical protein [Yinghuangia seranimata]